MNYKIIIILLCFLLFPCCANSTNIENSTINDSKTELASTPSTNTPDEDTFEVIEQKRLKAKDRCAKYMKDVRKAGFFYLGLTFPWYYNMGCMKQESNCRADIVSFDGGIGLYQFTPSTGIVDEIKKDLGIPFDPFRPDHSAKAQAYYISKLIKSAKTPALTFRTVKIYPKKYTDTCGLKLADIYQRYNGGNWLYYEIHKSGYSCDKEEIRNFCGRSGAWVGNPKRWLSFCDVNYKYPGQIYTYGSVYRTFNSTEWRYW
jgi:hypothetical protein